MFSATSRPAVALIHPRGIFKPHTKHLELVDKSPSTNTEITNKWSVPPLSHASSWRVHLVLFLVFFKLLSSDTSKQLKVSITCHTAFKEGGELRVSINRPVIKGWAVRIESLR